MTKDTSTTSQGQPASTAESARGLPGTHVKERIGFWDVPATISRNNFQHKSLSCWAINEFIGCGHGCVICYVPDTSTNKQAPKLAEYGVQDPDAEWGQYVLLRPFDEDKFLASLRQAENTPLSDLNADGNRAIIFCSTTDAYQVIRHPDPARQKTLNEALAFMVPRQLELIRDRSTLNVRILTRSPLARRDFDLYKSFGNRLLFGMSLPTLDNRLSRLYEPHAPAPKQRLAALRAAKAAGLHVFVAMAPVYPECDESDVRRTLTAIGALEPVTIFMEPGNIRGDNVHRIEEQAQRVGVALDTSVFATRAAWRRATLGSLLMVERLANELGLGDRLHLWPDPDLGSKAGFMKMRREGRAYSNASRQEIKSWKISDEQAYEQMRGWLLDWWSRISDWPGMPRGRRMTALGAA